MDHALDELTEKEKQALRLIVLGHDAKSSANELGLSVHTINERLRTSRRKLGTTSSREAARLLFESEGGTYETLVDKDLGEADEGGSEDTAERAAGTSSRRIIAGVLIMLTLSLGIVAALAITGDLQNDRPAGEPATLFESAMADQLEEKALDWLAIVDAGDWEASFAAAGRPFRDPNTIDSWREASEQVRVPLGSVVNRKTETVALVEANRSDPSSQERVIVRFTTDFENRVGVIEKVTLEQEHGEWRVMGYVID